MLYLAANPMQAKRTHFCCEWSVLWMGFVGLVESWNVPSRQ
jgi:hypothetical protein